MNSVILNHELSVQLCKILRGVGTLPVLNVVRYLEPLQYFKILDSSVGCVREFDVKTIPVPV